MNPAGRSRSHGEARLTAEKALFTIISEGGMELWRIG